MSEIKIEKGIPVQSKTKYPFKQMNIGDSFICKTANGIYTCAKNASVKIQVRSTDDGYRVWRVK